jgi:hypothetical protein
MQHTVYSLALERAARILGGSAALQDYLHVPSLDLIRWRTGQERPPVVIFLRVVDLLDARAGDATPVGAKARPGSRISAQKRSAERSGHPAA